jgi:hypothetical protein
MTVCHLEPRVFASHREPLQHGMVRRLQVHRRLTTAIGSRSAQQSITVPPWRCPIVTGPLAVIAVGTAWGAAIGFALGGGVGALFFLIGAIYGAPIGAIVGLIVALPASLVIATTLLVLDRPATSIERLSGHVAAVLAALIELLAVAFLATITIAVVAGGDLKDLRGVAAAVIPVIILGAAAAWFLRFAARDLVRVWARAWGRMVIR